MLTKFKPRPRGRPTDGEEPKKVLRAARIEKTLDDDFMLACKTLELSPSEGVRHAIILFVREFAKHYP